MKRFLLAAVAALMTGSLAGQAMPPQCVATKYFGVSGCAAQNGACPSGYHKQAVGPTNPAIKAPTKLMCVADAEAAAANPSAENAAAASPVIVGALEQTPGMFASERPYRSVRALFSKSEDGWKVFPSECADEECLDSLPQKYPASVDWTIAYHGRSLGQVSTARPMKFDLYSSVGQEGITSAGTVPSVGKPSKEFAGFLAEPVLRPLVAVSQPHFADPDGWKEATLSPALTAELRKSFRARFEQVQNCTREDAGEAVPWHYSDHEIQMSQAWRSRRGWWLAEMMLTDNACDGPAADPSNDPFSPQWFTVDPQGAIKFLAGEMHFVDAGDYAGDGKSELLFSIDDYDFGGYRLFYDDFQKKAEFEFSFH